MVRGLEWVWAGPGSGWVRAETPGCSGRYDFRSTLGDGMRHARGMTSLRKGATGMATKVKVHDKVTATRDYPVPGLLTPRRTLKARTTCIVLKIHPGLYYVYSFDVRNPKTGEIFRRVPAEVFGH
jgi:hypothetical protein